MTPNQYISLCMTEVQHCQPAFNQMAADLVMYPETQRNLVMTLSDGSKYVMLMTPFEVYQEDLMNGQARDDAIEAADEFISYLWNTAPSSDEPDHIGFTHIHSDTPAQNETVVALMNDARNKLKQLRKETV